MSVPSAAAFIEITLVYGGLPELFEQRFSVPLDTTVGTWLDSMKHISPYRDWPWHGLAIFGEVVADTTVLQDGDRVEWLMALKVDPKEARRKRAPVRRRKN
jgi:putative ubiquitin-RnfH superfamily antitoxin RatB of RatAB toxin-antitoxin module